MSRRSDEEKDRKEDAEELDQVLDDSEADGDGEDLDVTGIMASTLAGATTRQRREHARRRLEDYIEQKRAAKELSDLDGYDFDD